MGLINTLKFITKHPLNTRHPAKAIQRFLRWQIGSRLLKAPVAMPFVNQASLLITPGMTGATGNVYAGLHEVEEMALTLHLLRAEDDFIDIGANIGSYTILAAGVVGSRCLSIEPIPETYEKLLNNIYLNRLINRVTALNIGLGDTQSTLQFSTNQDTTNHVLKQSEATASIDKINVPVERLDEIAQEYSPVLIKIDVEGFEYPVLNGATKILHNPSLLAVTLETNGSGEHYGYSDQKVDHFMREQGFNAAHVMTHSPVNSTPYQRANITTETPSISAILQKHNPESNQHPVSS